MNTIFPLMNAVWLAHLDTANPEKALDTSPDNRSKKKKSMDILGGAVSCQEMTHCCDTQHWPIVTWFPLSC